MSKMKHKKLRMTQETETGLNTKFINLDTGRHISLEQAIIQIEKGNPSYGDYHIVRNPNGPDFIRSNPDGKAKNNLE